MKGGNVRGKVNGVSPIVQDAAFKHFRSTGCHERELAEKFGITVAQAGKVVSKGLFLLNQVAAQKEFKETMVDIDKMNGAKKPMLFGFPSDLIQYLS